MKHLLKQANGLFSTFYRAMIRRARLCHSK